MTVLVHGMQGLGDNLHQRAIVRQLMQREVVFLETPFPSVYHDLVGDRLKLLRRSFGLRTQKKNAAREAHLYESREPVNCRHMRVWYKPEQVRRTGSVLAAMMETCECDIKQADFRLPIAEAWRAKADELRSRWQTDKPIMIYRPLVERKEWSGCPSRNPEHIAYAALLGSVAERFFVVSVADLEPNLEWIVGSRVQADATFHAGELDFGTLAAITSAASLVYCSPGFAVVLAQAVSTPAVCVFGGYENSNSFSAGAKLSPYIGIDPINPCQCWSHSHACDKRIDLQNAVMRIKAFTDEHCPRAAAAH